MIHYDDAERGRETVTEYLGIVTGEAIMGANMFKDIFAGIRDIVGGARGAYEEELRRGEGYRHARAGG